MYVSIVYARLYVRTCKSADCWSMAIK